MNDKLVFATCALMSLACAAEVGDGAPTSEEVGETSSAGVLCDPMRLGTPGQRVKSPDSDKVYLIDPEGYKRWIGRAWVYEQLYGNEPESWSGIRTTWETPCIREREALWKTILFMLPGRPEVYFYEDSAAGEQYRWIASPAVMQKYHFSYSNIHQVTLDEFKKMSRGPTWH